MKDRDLAPNDPKHIAACRIAEADAAIQRLTEAAHFLRGLGDTAGAALADQAYHSALATGRRIREEAAKL